MQGGCEGRGMQGAGARDVAHGAGMREGRSMQGGCKGHGTQGRRKQRATCCVGVSVDIACRVVVGVVVDVGMWAGALPMWERRCGVVVSSLSMWRCGADIVGGHVVVVETLYGCGH